MGVGISTRKDVEPMATTISARGWDRSVRSLADLEPDVGLRIAFAARSRPLRQVPAAGREDGRPGSTRAGCGFSSRQGHLKLALSGDPGHNSRTGCQRAMHRAFSRNLDQLVGHCRIGFPFDGNDALKAIDVSRPTLNNFAAVFAVVGRLLAVLDTHGEPPQRHLLVI